MGPVILTLPRITPATPAAVNSLPWNLGSAP